MSDYQSLVSLKDWVKFILENCPQNTLIIFVGTKCDLVDVLIDKETIQEEFRSIQKNNPDDIQIQ
jgi:GTPase SAR1 family protein